MPSAWRVYDKITGKRLRSYAAALPAERVQASLAERRGWLRLYHEPRGEDWERKGGEWRQLSAGADPATLRDRIMGEAEA